MTGAKFRRSGFVVWSCLWTAGGLAGGARPCICAQAGTMERNFAQAPGLSRPATLRRGLSEGGPESLTPAGMDRFPFQHRSGSAFWWLPFICLFSLPHSSPYRPRSARPAALGYTSADTVPAPRQNDRVHSAPVPAHTWRSARPTVERPLDRPRAPSASAASGQPPVLSSSDRAACAGAWPTHAAMRICAHFS